ncbi:MAG: hypothetical protein V4596_12765 [Bdellovibrionota bacterium]
MRKKLLVQTTEYMYCIVAKLNNRPNNKELFDLNEKDCWNLFCHVLMDTQKKFNLQIHAFLMINNHIHLLASTPDENIDKAILYFMTTTSKAIGFLTNKTHRVWKSKYERTLITSPENYAHAFKYLYSHPLRAGIENSIENYKWSTIDSKKYSKYKNKLIIEQPQSFDSYIPESRNQLLAWINHTDDVYYTEQVRTALEKSVFEFPNDDGVKKYEYFKNFLLKK